MLAIDLLKKKKNEKKSFQIHTNCPTFALLYLIFKLK